MKQQNQKIQNCKYEKALTYENTKWLLKGRQKVFNIFESKIFWIGKTDTKKRNKILNPQKMLKKLPISLAQVKAGNTLENVLNEMGEIMYSLYRVKQITKNTYSNIMNSAEW